MLKSARLLVLIALVLGCVQAQATGITPSTVQYFTHYDITLDAGQSDITNLMLMETENSLTWAFSTNCGGTGCTTEIDNPFGSTNVPTTALLVGLANSGQDVVLVTNTAFASAAAGQDWSTLFPSTDEPTFLSEIALATSGGPFCTGPGTPVGCINPGLDAVSAFGAGDGAGAYFNIDSGTFSVLEFSTGQLIGSGTSFVTSQNTPNPSPVPEPSTLLLLGSGVMGLAGAMRRKLGQRA